MPESIRGIGGYLASFLQAVQVNLWKTDGQERSVAHYLP